MVRGMLRSHCNRWPGIDVADGMTSPIACTGQPFASFPRKSMYFSLSSADLLNLFTLILYVFTLCFLQWRRIRSELVPPYVYIPSYTYNP